MQGVYCPGDVHWACLEASALGRLIAACPAWKRRFETSDKLQNVSQSVSVISTEYVSLLLNVKSSLQSVLRNMSAVCWGCCQNQ